MKNKNTIQTQIMRMQAEIDLLEENPTPRARRQVADLQERIEKLETKMRLIESPILKAKGA